LLLMTLCMLNGLLLNRWAWQVHTVQEYSYLQLVDFWLYPGILSTQGTGDIPSILTRGCPMDGTSQDIPSILT